MKTVHWRATDPEHRMASRVSWAAGMYYPMLNKFFETFFRGDFPNQGKQVYKDHVEEVRSLVPSDRLLEYKITDGWGPLCEFLGEEVPDTPFPSGNDMANFKKRCSTRNRMQMLNAALQACTMGGALLLTGVAGMIIYSRYTIR
jgi:hypothetical protein